MAAALAPFFQQVIATHSQHPRAMAAPAVREAFSKYGIETKTADDTVEAISLARSNAGEQDLICISGSLFVVAEALACLRPAGQRL